MAAMRWGMGQIQDSKEASTARREHLLLHLRALYPPLAEFSN